jgi:hypothetical protein
MFSSSILIGYFPSSVVLGVVDKEGPGHLVGVILLWVVVVVIVVIVVIVDMYIRSPEEEHSR